jgi:hypothetical protein
MRIRWALFAAFLAAAAWGLGRHRIDPVAPARAVRPPQVPVAMATPEPPAEPPKPAVAPSKSDLKERLASVDRAGLIAMEADLEAQLLEDHGVADLLFDAFRRETDPVKMSFLANVLASDPPLRNAEAWQDRFLSLAERDPSFERRAAALLFLQQAETLRPVLDRMLSLAENDRELSPNTLAALKGLPEQRRPDPRVGALAGRIADREPDPVLRGIALRIEDDPAHATRFLSDPDRTVRMQASRVTTSREAVEAALRKESDAEVREMFQARLEELP